MSDFTTVPIWAECLQDQYLLNNFMRQMVDNMAIKGYVKGVTWQEALNRFVADLNDEHECKMHPERYRE